MSRDGPRAVVTIILNTFAFIEEKLEAERDRGKKKTPWLVTRNKERTIGQVVWGKNGNKNSDKRETNCTLLRKFQTKKENSIQKKKKNVCEPLQLGVKGSIREKEAKNRNVSKYI